MLLLAVCHLSAQQKLLIPMDLKQTDHLKAYGVAFWALQHGIQVDWLLYYRGGSFMVDYLSSEETECRIRGVAFEALSGSDAARIYAEIGDENTNMDAVRLEKVPKIAVYVPPDFKPWDDAVTLALEYAEIPYKKYGTTRCSRETFGNDWLHLHHEDFTGQYGKFYATHRNAPWYIEQQVLYERKARELGFKKVSDEKKAVARAIKDFVAGGGFMFAMCAATDTYDIALAAENTDICDVMFDGDPPDRDAQKKLDFSKTFAFQNFTLEMNPLRYEYSDIDIPPSDPVPLRYPNTDYFTLFEFSARSAVPTMLTQNHVNVIKGFMGQTTAFKKSLIKSSVTILAEREGTEEVKYIHRDFRTGNIHVLRRA